MMLHFYKLYKLMQGDKTYIRLQIDGAKSDLKSMTGDLNDLSLKASNRSSLLEPSEKISLDDLSFSFPGRKGMCRWKKIRGEDFKHIPTVHMTTNQLQHLV